MAPRRTCSPEDILSGHSADVVALAARVRALVRRLAPSLTEAGYPGWRLIGLTAHGYVGFIAPLPGEVRLGFEHGTSLPDPDGALEGTGTQVRHLVFRRPSDVRAARVGPFLAAALMEDEARHAQRSARTRGARKRTAPPRG